MAKQYGLINMKKKSEDVRTKREVKEVMDKALEEDPNIFLYDEIYDDIHEKRDQTAAGASTGSGDGAKKKSKFIGNLKLNAEKRKIAEEHRIDRKIEREREAEGDQFADKESFVTEAYRQKLLERKLYEEREKKEIELEELMDARKQEHGMTAFYRNYLSQRVGEKVETKSKERFLDKVTEDLRKQLLGKQEDGQKSESVEFKKSNKSSQHSKRQRRSSSSSEEEDVVVRDLRKNKERKKTNHEREDKKQREKAREVAEVTNSEQKPARSAERIEEKTSDLKESKGSKDEQTGAKTEEPVDKRPDDERPIEPEQPRLTLREILTELFRKRCVGEEFAEQQRKYFERRANCQS